MPLYCIQLNQGISVFSVDNLDRICAPFCTTMITIGAIINDRQVNKTTSISVEQTRTEIN